MENEDKKMEEILEKGVEYLKDGQFQEAIGVFEKLIAADENDAVAHFNLGLACMRIAREDIDKEELYEKKTDEEGWILRAIAEFNKVLDIEPDNGEARENIAVLNKLLNMGV
ncbi:MAG: hypothetical protein E3J78_04770 [Candidatus Cloacimonadota bacterium]|jgi:Flp pilus assembly protein TadD|nr:MAG: hypothetical protein E3J78_04770 [Candidatus Cloacimonadota bacterium]